MSYFEILAILSLHWFADFVCQTDEQAKNKSTSLDYLLDHTIIYSFIIWVGMIFLLGEKALEFAGITLLAHTLTDYFTSKLNSKLWKKNQVHNFFVSIGFDQLLHYAQLFATYFYLTK